MKDSSLVIKRKMSKSEYAKLLDFVESDANIFKSKGEHPPLQVATVLDAKEAMGRDRVTVKIGFTGKVMLGNECQQVPVTLLLDLLDLLDIFPYESSSRKDAS